jgi:catalase
LPQLTLFSQPDNYFAEIEQAAFSPSHMVPGVEPSADPVLQSRLFSYPDTHRHRLGVNYQQIPANCPLRAFNPFQRDGSMQTNGNYGANPNYPSTFRPVTYKPVLPSQQHEKWSGAAVNYSHEVVDDDFVQPNGLWQVLGRTPGQQDNFVYNVSVHLKNANPEVQKRTFGMFSKVNPELGKRIEEATTKAVQADKQANGSAQARL